MIHAYPIDGMYVFVHIHRYIAVLVMSDGASVEVDFCIYARFADIEYVLDILQEVLDR